MQMNSELQLSLKSIRRFCLHTLMSFAILLTLSQNAWAGVQEDALYYTQKARITYAQGDYLRTIALLQNFFEEVGKSTKTPSTLSQKNEELIQNSFLFFVVMEELQKQEMGI